MKRNGHVPRPDDEQSDPSVPVVKGDLRAAQSHVEHTIGQRLTVNYIVTLAMVVAACWGVLKVVLHEAQAQTDAGVQLVQTRADERFRAIEQRLDRTDKQADRMEQKLDRLMEGLRIPNPAPAPKDGGP